MSRVTVKGSFKEFDLLQDTTRALGDRYSAASTSGELQYPPYLIRFSKCGIVDGRWINSGANHELYGYGSFPCAYHLWLETVADLQLPVLHNLQVGT